MLNRKPTPTSKSPHIKMKTKRKTVLAFDRPPRKRFFWKTLENQRATVTAKSAFPAEAGSMIRAAIGDPVRKTVIVTWLSIEPPTTQSTDLTKDNRVISEESFRVIGKVDNNFEDSAL